MEPDKRNIRFLQALREKRCRATIPLRRNFVNILLRLYICKGEFSLTGFEWCSSLRYQNKKSLYFLSKIQQIRKTFRSCTAMERDSCRYFTLMQTLLPSADNLHYLLFFSTIGSYLAATVKQGMPITIRRNTRSSFNGEFLYWSPHFCLGTGNPVVSDRNPGDFFITCWTIPGSRPP